MLGRNLSLIDKILIQADNGIRRLIRRFKIISYEVILNTIDKSRRVKHNSTKLIKIPNR